MKALLVCMPFADPARPALGLSLLKACLEANGIACDVAYFNLAFARLLGIERYQHLAEKTPPAALAGEWVFRDAVWSEVGDHSESYIHDVLEDGWSVQGSVLDSVRLARANASGFLRWCHDAVRWDAYGLVGFGSTVAQNLASLGLATLIKDSCPEVSIVFGGHNWEGSMGRVLFGHYACVDYVCAGDADLALPSLAAALAKGDPAAASAVPGVLARGRGPGPRRPATRASLRRLPLPDHGDFFSQLRQHGLEDDVTPVVPMETSRGCWWASRRPCRFCGINGDRRDYVHKGGDRMGEEVQSLSAAWPGLRIDVVDNLVPRCFLQRVLPVLKGQEGISIRIRPDVADADLERIAAAGGSVTCGIESLDAHILKLLGKGVDALDNVRFLRRCADLGIRVDWNLLHGVPGETAQDYSRQAGLVESLGELEPPRAVMPIQVERWSTYWDRPGTYGFGRLRPSAAYAHVYPFDRDALSRVAYFFDHEYCPPLRVALHVARLRRAVGEWREHDRSRRGGERRDMANGKVDDWGRSAIGYLHGRSETWDEHVKSLKAEGDSGHVTRIGGTCPVCAHPVSKPIESVKIAALHSDGGPGDVYIFTCNCTFAHPGAPDGVRGCGAQGPFGLVSGKDRPEVVRAEATIEQYEADDWVESALRHRLARAREWSAQWSNLLAAIIGFVSVAAIFDADAEGMGLKGSAWTGYLVLTGAALALAVIAVICASLSAGLRGVKDVQPDAASRETKMLAVLQSSGRLLRGSQILAAVAAVCLAAALVIRFTA